MMSSLTFLAEGPACPRRAGAPERGDARAPVLAAGVAERCRQITSDMKDWRQVSLIRVSAFHDTVPSKSVFVKQGGSACHS